MVILDIIALILASIHFGIPVTYYYYIKKKWLPLPWNINTDPGYKPKVTIIVPTYNEADLIASKLDDLYAQDYPKNLIEIIVIDSGSNDGTAELVEEWASKHGDVNLKLLREKEREGKLSALLKALKHVSPESEIMVFTDADAFWDPTALGRAVRYFADPTVGAVSASMRYSEDKILENTYRAYYNLLRTSESKAYSTPVHNGPFLAIRAELLRKFGLPMFPGSDDSSFGSYIAFIGFRAIQVDDIVVKEPIRGSQVRRKIRRSQHLLLNFLKTKRYAKRLGVYKYTKQVERIWKVEWWLHIINPWVLATGAILLAINAFNGSLTALTLLGIGLALLFLKPYRMWVLQQLYLIIAAIRNIWTKEEKWKR